jgi:hypothetical protein
VKFFTHFYKKKANERFQALSCKDLRASFVMGDLELVLVEKANLSPVAMSLCFGDSLPPQAHACAPQIDAIRRRRRPTERDHFSHTPPHSLFA